MELPADLTGLQELVAKCEAVNEADCTSATWTVFAEKLAEAKAIAEGTARAAATAAQAEAARVGLLQAYAGLRYKGATLSAWLSCAPRSSPCIRRRTTRRPASPRTRALWMQPRLPWKPMTAATMSTSSSDCPGGWRSRSGTVFCLRNQRSNGEPRNGSGCPGQNPAVHRPGERHR